MLELLIKRVLLLIVLTVNGLIQGYSQVKVGDNPNSINANSILELESTDKAILVTRVANTGAITNPVNGMIIYDLSVNCFRYYQDNQWTDCGASHEGTITALNCGDASHFGFLQRGKSVNGVSSTIPYTGGNGNPHNGQTVNSTGVTGLTATLSAGSFASGNGSLSYTITGTPNSSGTASFALNIGGQSCTITRQVESLIVRVAYLNNFTIGHTDFATYNDQLQNSSNYGSSGTYTKVDGFNFIEITTTTLSTNTAGQLKEKFDIIATGYYNYSTSDANKIKSFVDLGGVAFLLLDQNIGTTLLTAFGGGSAGTSNGLSSLTSNTNTINNGVFGNATSTTLVGAGSYGDIAFSSMPPSSTSLTTSTSKAGVWLCGAGGRAIFSWDEGIFRSPSAVSGTSIDTDQERFVHNLMAYALDRLF